MAGQSCSPPPLLLYPKSQNPSAPSSSALCHQPDLGSLQLTAQPGKVIQTLFDLVTSSTQTCDRGARPQAGPGVLGTCHWPPGCPDPFLSSPSWAGVGGPAGCQPLRQDRGSRRDSLAVAAASAAQHWPGAKTFTALCSRCQSPLLPRGLWLLHVSHSAWPPSWRFGVYYTGSSRNFDPRASSQIIVLLLLPPSSS